MTPQLLTGGQEGEVLAFLGGRPTHTVMLAGFVRDNGLTCPHNRGSFYVCRDGAGGLEGVALIGEITTFEVRTDAALSAFARCARGAPKVGVIIGERDKVQSFWRQYAADGQAPPTVRREMLFELRDATPEPAPAVDGLRTATLDDIDQVLAAHAGMAYAESGVDPMEVDPEGFRERCARRIRQGRVWVLIDGGRLIFKADIASETPDAAYLEGVYVNPAERGKGYAFRCLSQASGILLGRAKSVCVLVDEENRGAQRLYRKANFQLRGCYETIFLP